MSIVSGQKVVFDKSFFLVYTSSMTDLNNNQTQPKSRLDNFKSYIAIALFIFYVLFVSMYVRIPFTLLTGYPLFADNLYFLLHFDKLPNFAGETLFNSLTSFVYNFFIEVIFIWFIGNDLFGKLLNVQYLESKNIKQKLYLKTFLKYLIVFTFTVRTSLSNIGNDLLITSWGILVVSILISDICIRIQTKSKSNLLNKISKISFT